MKESLQKLIARLGRASTVLIPLILILTFLLGWWIGRPSAQPENSATAGESGTIWTCSMHPTVRQPGPGLCPICEMDLIEVSAEPAGGLRELKLPPDAVARLNIRVAPVMRQPATNRLRFLGRVAPDETRVTKTTARMDGRLDRLFVDYTGISVRKGDHLAEIYSPDLYVAQEELIQARKALAENPSSTREALYRASREKLRLLGIKPEQIDAIEKKDAPSDHLTLNAPQDGIVLELFKREGDYVKTGEPLYALADLSQVWVFLEAYEADLPWLRFAQEVEFHAEALPGRTFTGKIAFIDPILDETRRIARIRVNVPNPDGDLKPGMFVRGEVLSVLAGDRVMEPELAGKWISPMHPEIIKDGPGQCDICGMDLVPAEELGFTTGGDPGPLPLLVPASAVLRTGERAVVYVRHASGDGLTFEGREIVLGPRAGDFFVVENGLDEADLVVTRGAFKLDSELQIQARPAMMLDGQGIGEGSGVVAPDTVTGAWQPVLRVLARARENLSDPEEFTKNLETARSILTAIEPDFLPDDYAPLWKEAKMRLGNLFVAARETAERSGSEKGWQQITRELPVAAGIAGLGWQLPEQQGLPPDDLALLKEIIAAYLTVSDHLAHDKPTEALAAAPALGKLLKDAPFEKAPEAVKALALADSEESLRAVLKTVTDALRPTVRTFANDQLGALYLVHCPMAFDNTGADWFSREPKVENPYFGSMMFSCGDVTETLSLPTGNTTGEKSEHSGHQN